MVRGAVFFVVVPVQMVVGDVHALKGPQPFAGVVVKLLGDQNVVQGFAKVLVNVGIVHVAIAAILLQSAHCIEVNVAATLLQTAQNIVGLAGEDIEGVAVFTVI